MNFFGTKIQPVLYVDVNVYPEFNRSEIVVRRAETVGSEMADKVNGTFSISAINIVSAGMTGGKNHCSSGSIRCSLLKRNLNLPILPCVTFQHCIFFLILRWKLRNFPHYILACRKIGKEHFYI